MIKCSINGCPSEMKDHAWSKIRSEWFSTKAGAHYCPDHIPDWVAEWRRSKGGRK